MMIKTKSTPLVTCALVGDGLVGKTSLAMAFVRNCFPKRYVATIFDNFAGSVTVEGTKYALSLYDTAGQQDYEGLRVFTYKHSDVILVCYSAADRDSYNSVKDFWVPEVRSYAGSKKPIVLVATQTDMRDAYVDESNIPVSEEEGLALAKDIGAEQFIACSAAKGVRISSVFEQVVRSAMRHKKKKNFLKRFLSI